MLRIRTPLAALLLLAPAAGSAQDADKAMLRVYLPVADARLEIQGKPTARTGTTRLFESRVLAPGKAFLYDLKATWMENGKTVVREKSARVMAGKTTEIDMGVEDKPEAVKPPVKPDDPPVKPDMPPVKPADPPKPPPPPPDPPKAPAELVAPFVVTPEPVVEEMLKLAKVKDGDVVYDLGCGDGRIVITAVTKYKAKKGIGLDIDPVRVKESQENAKKADAAAKTEFKQGDVLALTEQDLAEATVVTLYLHPKLNAKLAPVLKKLKPGTRIVSHDFNIPDWPEDEKKDLQHNNLDHSIYLWIVK